MREVEEAIERESLRVENLCLELRKWAAALENTDYPDELIAVINQARTDLRALLASHARLMNELNEKSELLGAEQAITRECGLEIDRLRAALTAGEAEPKPDPFWQFKTLRDLWWD